MSIRSLRKDADTLYNEIHSHPILSQDYIANTDDLQKDVARRLNHLASLLRLACGLPVH